jgi:hypothetical protein
MLPWLVMSRAKDARHTYGKPVFEFCKSLIDFSFFCKCNHCWERKVIHFCNEDSLICAGHCQGFVDLKTVKLGTLQLRKLEWLLYLANLGKKE